MSRDKVFFLFSLVFSLFAELLNAWGPPEWFSYFPYAAGLRFLLSLEVYFFCCAVFFAFRITFFPDKTRHAFVKAFCFSFAAIPVFSLLVTLNSRVHILQTFVRVVDIAGWLSVLVLALRKPAWDRLLFSSLFFLSGVLLLVPGVPSIMMVAVRFITLAIFSAIGLEAAQNGKIELAVQGPTDFRDVAGRFSLSPREAEVLSLLVAGKTNNEIAGVLFISLSTVKTHIASIFMKTGARNRLEASSLCKKA